MWTAATHAQPAWEHATRLVISSPLKQCGKTRLQEVIAGTAHNVLRTINISPAALVRSIDEKDPPTLVLDEADSVFATRRGERSEGAEDLRGILNSGHSRGWPYVRWDAAARRPESCPTFAMAAIGGIGSMPDTIEDRAVVIPMRRRAPGEKVSGYRSRRAVPTLHDLRERLHEVITAHLDELAAAEPDLPVDDRPADVWESLIAVADLAGADWPRRARLACQILTGAAEPDEASISERLLADLASVFTRYDAIGTATYVEEIFTADLLKYLHQIEEAPWGDWYGRELTGCDLARLLRPYGIRSRNVRIGDGQGKGYRSCDLAEAWFRYLPRPGRPAVPAMLNRAGTDGQKIGTVGENHPSPQDSRSKSDPWDAGTAGTHGVPSAATLPVDGTDWIEIEAARQGGEIND